MVPVGGRGQLSFSTSPGCTEHTVGLEIWYLFDASAERVGWGGRRGGGGREEKRGGAKDGLEEEEGAQDGGKRGGRGGNKP